MKWIVGVVVAAVLFGAGYYVATHPEWRTSIGSTSSLQSLLSLPGRVRATLPQRGEAESPEASAKVQSAAPNGNTGTTSSAAAARPALPSAPTPPAPRQREVTLFLTNGGVVTGDLVADTAQGVTLRWEYGDVTFARHEIRRVVSGKATPEQDDIVLPASAAEARAWKYQHDVVFRLLNGSVIDAELIAVEGEQLQLRQAVEGGGSVELSIPRAQLDQLMFRRVENERTAQVRAALEQLFPSMHWYDDGLFVLVTDSIRPDVNGYWRTIRELSADWYLTFYPLLRGRAPQTQQFIVIFDDWGDYMEYALSDGVPGWLAVGYFLPQDEVLYTFNMLGQRFSELLYEAFLGRARAVVDQAVAGAKGSVENRYEIFLEGQGIELKAKFERADAIIRAGYRRMTEETLRHELVHGLFHNWGLQTIVTSTMASQDTELAKKKRQYLAATDVENKRRLLIELLNPEAREAVELQASNSWLNEGLAAYLEVTPVGAVNPSWCYMLQRAQQDQQLLPLSTLASFRLGSFPSLTHKAQAYAYAQSWALVNFLMQRYPQGFFAFLERLAREPAAHHYEELAWLEAALGVPLAQLEQEFHVHLAQWPTQETPWLAQYDALLEIFRGF